MKKVLLSIFMVLMIIGLTTIAWAAEEYQFKLEYTGDIIANEPKDAKVLLVANNGTLYNKVQVKAEAVSGPATPKIVAYDEHGTEFDLTQTGTWGPNEGFTVTGTFTNETAIKITYPVAGTYTSRISLINLENSSVITSNEFTITVLAKEIQNNNSNITELPQTGYTIWNYLTVIALIVVLALGIVWIKRKHV